MKKLYPYLCLVCVLALVVPAYGGNEGNGNGAPSGPHYNLNIIGVPKDKTADMDDNNGHRIFVKLYNKTDKTKILLTEGEYQVLDANGTDGTAAFQLPRADDGNGGVTEYSVWVRALGKPGGSAVIATCATDPSTGDEECAVEQYTLTMRTKGKGGNKFTNVSSYLLYVYADLGDGIQLYPLFGDALEDYFWSYNNNGLKLAQFRFYEMPTQEPDLGEFE
jgi:hypothetical protein